MSSEPAAKKQRTQPSYELLYHPGIPGRGEFIRLAFEATGTPYVDLANEQDGGYQEVQRICVRGQAAESDAGNAPIFSPPALRVTDGGKTWVIGQTPNVLSYLGERLGLAAGEAGPDARYLVAQVAMTALDLNDEVHDTHHPVGVALYYEDQRAEALRKARDVREARLPKFFSYFERTLRFNAEKEGGGGRGRYMVGDRLSYADTTVWQVLDGLYFAFPREMEARKEEYPQLLDTFYQGVRAESGLKEYLSSERRLPYSMGIFRHYPELDRQD